jgi:hypothetical protein
MYSLYAVRYVYMYTYTSQYKDACPSKEIILGTAVNFARRRFASPGLASWFSIITFLDVETKRKICNPFRNEIIQTGPALYLEVKIGLHFKLEYIYKF